MKRIACLVTKKADASQVTCVKSVLAEFGEVKMVPYFRESREALATVREADLIYVFNPAGTVDERIADLLRFCAERKKPTYAFREIIGLNFPEPLVRAVIPPIRMIEVINQR